MCLPSIEVKHSFSSPSTYLPWGYVWTVYDEVSSGVIYYGFEIDKVKAGISAKRALEKALSACKHCKGFCIYRREGGD